MGVPEARVEDEADELVSSLHVAENGDNSAEGLVIDVGLTHMHPPSPLP